MLLVCSGAGVLRACVSRAAPYTQPETSASLSDKVMVKSMVAEKRFDSIRFEVVYSDHRNIPNCRFSGVVERSSVGEN